MDFDSPDVAKEFPGLARALSDAVDEYEDREKSKKKKDKKDSKKDKDKGYAALNDSPDEEEGETKSPGKGMKIKAFKLTTKKKDKEKGQPKAPEKERAKSLSSEVEKKIMKEDKQSSVSLTATVSAAVTLKPTDAVATASGPPGQQPRRPFDGQGYKHSPPGGQLTKSTKKVRQSSSDTVGVSPSSAASAAKSTTAKTTSSAEKKGLNVFLNAPVPMLLKKKESKEKDFKKEHGHGLSAAKVKLKLKRGSKSSLDEVSGAESTPTALPSSSHPHLPEDPELISKEIKKHEAMLEQAHAQVKSGKKVSKKTEEQLWELQRNLTQLKRKLRSINALSASYAPPPTASSTLPSAKTASSSSEGDTVGMKPPPPPSETVNPLLPAPPSPCLPLSETTAATTVEEAPLDSTTGSSTLTTTSQIQVAEIDRITTTISVTTVDTLEEPLDREGTSPADLTSQVDVDPVHETETERRDTIQVQAEVHSSVLSQENPTPEDIYEQEIQSFNAVEDGACAPLGKRENIEKGRRLLHIQETPESTQSKSEEPSGGAESVEEVDSGPQRQNKTDPEDGEHNFLQPGPRSAKSRKQSQEDEVPADEPSKKLITAPSIFDPFALLEFKTDEFIAAENEALIQFNQQLQDEIVREEEQIEELIQQIQEINSERDPGASKLDLLELDDDELVSLWQIVKFENDALNEQVLNLKTMVANSRLEEFRLETRVKYLNEKKHGGVLKPDAESAVVA